MAIYFLKESANRPLPGSMPSVDTQAEANELVATQDENPLIDLDELPFETQDITRCLGRRRLPGSAACNLDQGLSGPSCSPRSKARPACFLGEARGRAFAVAG